MLASTYLERRGWQPGRELGCKERDTSPPERGLGKPAVFTAQAGFLAGRRQAPFTPTPQSALRAGAAPPCHTPLSGGEEEARGRGQGVPLRLGLCSPAALTRGAQRPWVKRRVR